MDKLREIVRVLLKTKFKSLDGREIKIQWSDSEVLDGFHYDGKIHKFLHEVDGISEEEMVGAWIVWEDRKALPTIYLNEEIRWMEEEDLPRLCDLIEHELLHIETDIEDGEKFERLCKERGIYCFKRGND